MPTKKLTINNFIEIYFIYIIILILKKYI